MRVLVHGTGGMGRETADWAAAAGLDVIGFLDDDTDVHGTVVNGLTVLGGRDVLDQEPEARLVVAVGAPDVRARLVAAHAGRLASVVHPSAQVGARTHLGSGVVLAPNVVLTIDGAVGDGVIVNYGAVVGHDAVLGEACFIGPGAAIAGDVTVQERAWVGIGASVLQGVTIGADAVVGAGAVVVDDVAPGTTVVGVPARPMGG